MRIATAVLAVFFFAVVCYANPTLDDPTLFFDFDPDGVPDDDIHLSTYPPPYVTVDAYIALSCQNEPGEQITTISFALEDPRIAYPGVMATAAFTPLLPGGLAIGDPFVGGITVASTECMTDPIVYIGQLSMFYLGGACQLRILDHTSYPRWVVDCQDPGQVTFYCDYAAAGVNTPHEVSEEFCSPPEYCSVVPVEDVSWGAIKAMYN